MFGPTDPSPDDIEAFWTQVDDIVAGMGNGRSAWQRLGARLSIRTLLEGTRFALPARPAPRSRTPQPAATPAHDPGTPNSSTRRSRRGSTTRSAPEPSAHPTQENE